MWRSPGRLLLAASALARARLVLVFLLLGLSLAGLGLSTSSAEAETQGEAIVQQATKWEGRPYCFAGGNENEPTLGKADPEQGPDHGLFCGSAGYDHSNTPGFDCTGLTMYAVYQVTKDVLVHDSYQAREAIARYDPQVIYNESELEPGDLVYFGGSLDDFVHAGIYVGNKSFVSAVTEGIGVTTTTMKWEEAEQHFVGAIRLWSGNAGGNPYANGAEIQTPNQNVYVVAGGAALPVSSCAAIGGCNIMISVSSLAGYASVPANGTELSDLSGDVWIVAGGAALKVSACSAIGGCAGNVLVDPAAVAALRSIPANGTELSDLSGDVWIVAGGAALKVSACSAIGGCAGNVLVDPAAVAALGSVPANGTFISFSSGAAYRVAGGAALLLSSCAPLNNCAGDVLVDPAGATALLAAQPANGTVLEGVPSDQYWTISAGDRSPTIATSSAIAVNDSTISAIPLAPSSPGPTTPTSSTTSTPASPASNSTGSSSESGSGNNPAKTPTPSNGVLGAKTGKSPKGVPALSRALAKCRTFRTRHERTKCEAAAKRRHGSKHAATHHPKRAKQ
jgi:cell wall-associated NlpC family hydrolase